MTGATTQSQQIDAKLAALGDWRGATLARLRAVLLSADPRISESIKWVKPSNPGGVIAWECAGMLCTGEIYKTYVKLTFAHGAALEDPHHVFNSSLAGGTRRAIDIREGETIDPAALVALVERAVAFNHAKQASKKTR